MSKKKIQIELTDVEIRHILTLLDINEREEFYYGNKEQYWARHLRVKETLEQGIAKS